MMRKRILLAALCSALLANPAFSQAIEEVTFQKGIAYEVYHKMTRDNPDFSKTPDVEGKTGSLTMAISPYEINYAVRYRGKFDVPVTGKYKITATTTQIRSLGDIAIDGEKLYDFDRMPVFKIVELEEGTHDYTLTCFKDRAGEEEVKFEIEPYHLLIDENQLAKRFYIYFGWSEMHPKANSLMGGALYPRRPKMIKGEHGAQIWANTQPPWHKNSMDVVLFLLSVDGGEPYYPDEFAEDRRKTINWSLAENYLPAPTSIWQKDHVEMKIQHFGRRLLHDKANVIYSRVTVRNLDNKPQKVKVLLNGTNVSERALETGSTRMQKENDHLLFTEKVLEGGEAAIYDFVFPANGIASKEEILNEGGYDWNYRIMKSEIDEKMSGLTMPVSLPDERFVDLWKSSMPFMWNALVRTPTDLQQRADGGNVAGFPQYDHTFNHDIPNMAIQYTMEGNWELARDIMTGDSFETLSKGRPEGNKYNDAGPKFITAMAQYLQLSGDREFFTEELLATITSCAHSVSDMREAQMDESLRGVGAYGLIEKGGTLDNGGNFLLVDNFAALHGFQAYHYICEQFGMQEEKEWAAETAADLNQCLNDVLDASMKAMGVDWYFAYFNFDINELSIKGPGNWLGTSLMMSSFPWNAWLKGFEHGGTWKDHFDRSVEHWMGKAAALGLPDGSFGAWWAFPAGSVYNAGMAMPLLYSDKYRTYSVKSIEWLLDMQSVPYNWGESFRIFKEGDWTRPTIGLETWGLGFIRQCMLQACVSVHTDGTIILGRGITDEWLNSGKAIAWKNVRINNNKKIDFSIQRTGHEIKVYLKGDRTEGNVVVDIPMCVDNLALVQTKTGKIVKKDFKNGKVWLSGDTKDISIKLKR
jgi:hypothetical protein